MNLRAMLLKCELDTINLRALAMVAANQERLIKGESLAYPEEPFVLLVQEAQSVYLQLAQLCQEA